MSGDPLRERLISSEVLRRSLSETRAGKRKPAAKAASPKTRRKAA